MTLLDTNVLIYASDPRSELCRWARRTISEAVASDGAAVNAVSLAELCVGDADPATVAERIRRWGVQILDIPAAAAEVSARAYVNYRNRREKSTERGSPLVPLPDFFIGAHAQIIGWTLATADTDRYKTYFSRVRLKAP